MNPHPDQLIQRIEDRSALLGVIGLGYIGLPVALALAQAGFQVTGVDLNQERVTTINAGACPIEGDEPGLAELLANLVLVGKMQATTSYQRLERADVILICVDTPVNEQHEPEYKSLEAACRSLGMVMKPGVLVIVESTTAPGTITRIVKPILQESLSRRSPEHQDFMVGACPERVMPGRLLYNLRHMPRTCGGDTAQTSQAMIALYATIVEADLDPTDLVTAELVKTIENTYRDVQIAFANEVALICEANGGDVWQVRRLVNKSPQRDMHLPGAGVGGHCIPKDPWLLASSLSENEVSLRLIPAARAVNDEMPAHMADLLEDAMQQVGFKELNPQVVILGYTYREDTDDTRNSPSDALVNILQSRGIQVRVHDPIVAKYRGDLYQLATGCDGVILMVRHQSYRKIDLQKLVEALRTPILIDGRAMFDPKKVNSSGFIYRRIGTDPRKSDLEVLNDSTQEKGRAD